MATDIYSSYYTKSDFITNYMMSMLNVQEGHFVLEPSAGDGVFVDSLLGVAPNLRIDAYDLNSQAVSILRQKYFNRDNVQIYETDTLTNEQLDIYAMNQGYYDRVIGNPPWGAWQDYSKRKELKVRYNGHYVKETYSLFILRCLSVLKYGGVLTFIVPDTFLYLHRHTKLRQFILANSKIREIVIFPSRFFPGIQFGYSNICIFTMEKSTLSQAFSNNVRVIRGLKRETDLDDIKNSDNLDKFSVKLLNQKDIYNSPESSFLLNDEDTVSVLIKTAKTTLGDVADCVTGIYCGDNMRFMKVSSQGVRGGQKYEVIKSDEISDIQNLEGTDDAHRKYIPIVKGNSTARYFRGGSDWFIDWSKDAIYHYNNDKKARFQNSKFYFKKGIALPMVKSTKISATLMEGAVFDQSVVGVFPKGNNYILYMLALLNSETVRNIIQTINPTANNSANYIKKIPIVLPADNELSYIDDLTNKILTHMHDEEYDEADKLHQEVNELIRHLYT